VQKGRGHACFGEKGFEFVGSNPLVACLLCLEVEGMRALVGQENKREKFNSERNGVSKELKIKSGHLLSWCSILKW